MGLGTPEILILFFVILLVFGAKRLPELARGLGKSMTEFRRAASEAEAEVRSAIDEPAKKPDITPPAATPPAGVPPPPDQARKA